MKQHEHIADLEIGEDATQSSFTVQDEFGAGRPRDRSRLSPQGEQTAAHTQSRQDRDAAILSTLVPASKLYTQPERVWSLPPFLTQIEILPWPRQYDYYRSFCRDAERVAVMHGRPCAPAEFFSYIPQYSQMTNSQLAYYLWFRDCANEGRYLPGHAVSSSYVMLYIYEIINLPGIIPPEVGADRLARIWLAYRDRYRELTKYLAEWLCDYCLVHQTPLPAVLRGELDTLASAASLREFFLCGLAERDTPVLNGRILTATLSEYNYRTSKYYPANAAVFDEHLPAALEAAAEAMDWTRENPLREALSERDSFCGALCGPPSKRRIRVRYLSLSRSSALRAAVTATVRCAENLLRTALRISSRLKEGNVPPAARAAVEAYLAPLLPKKKSAPERPEWERLYDAPREELSSDASRRIEEASWTNAELLAARDDEDAEAVSEPPAGPAEETPDETPDGAPDDAPPAGADETLRAVLRACLSGSTFRAACESAGIPARDLDSTAGAINEALADAVGDAVLEHTPDGWEIVEDYATDIRDYAEG